jgi:NAD(P)H-hydrate repair Nnr-like enzyme with NAD(P)H-hydrate epimerase domain
VFKDAKDNPVEPVTTAQYLEILAALADEYGLTNEQVAESASLSMGMVVRSALGLYGADAAVGILGDNSLAGLTALTTGRVLRNAGCHIFVLRGHENYQSDEHRRALRSLIARGGVEINIDELRAQDALSPFLATLHNIVCGLDPFAQAGLIVEVLNEHSIPVHCIQAPSGLFAALSGTGEALYASSTLSLGLPMDFLATGAEWVGRHYLADIGFDYSRLNEQLARNIPVLFSEQPVIKLSFASGAEEESVLPDKR